MTIDIGIQERTVSGVDLDIDECLRGSRPSEALLAAVAELAYDCDCNPDAMLRGERFHIDGIGFWLHHDPGHDSSSVVLMMELCEFDRALRQDELAALVPDKVFLDGPLAGEFGLVPEAGTVVYCCRVRFEPQVDYGVSLATIARRLAMGFDRLFDCYCCDFSSAQSRELLLEASAA